MKMKRVDICVGDLGVGRQRRAGDDSLLVFVEQQGGIDFGDIVVPVADSVNDPCGLDIDENGLIVGGEGTSQNPHDSHFKWVTAGNVKDIVRIGQKPIPGLEPQALRHRRTENAVPQSTEHHSLSDPQLPKSEVVERRPHDRRRIECDA